MTTYASRTYDAPRRVYDDDYILPSRSYRYADDYVDDYDYYDRPTYTAPLKSYAYDDDRLEYSRPLRSYAYDDLDYDYDYSPTRSIEYSPTRSIDYSPTRSRVLRDYDAPRYGSLRTYDAYDAPLRSYGSVHSGYDGYDNGGYYAGPIRGGRRYGSFGSRSAIYDDLDY